MTAPRLSGMSPAHGAPYGPRSYFTRGIARFGPGRPVWVAEVRAVPQPHRHDQAHVTVWIGGKQVVALNHVPVSALPRLEGLIDCLHLDKVVRLLEGETLTAKENHS